MGEKFIWNHIAIRRRIQMRFLWETKNIVHEYSRGWTGKYQVHMPE